MQAAAVAVIIAVVLSLVGEIDAPARDRAQVRAFLRAQGLERTPEGYEVDHIIPLCAGGADSPENMQLLTFEEHQQKTSCKRCSRSGEMKINILRQHRKLRRNKK